MMVIPVALPPGRGRLETSPSFVGSPPITNTIGIEVVAALAARAELEPPAATSTATGSRASSAARAGSRSSSPSAQR